MIDGWIDVAMEAVHWAVGDRSWVFGGFRVWWSSSGPPRTARD